MINIVVRDREFCRIGISSRVRSVSATRNHLARKARSASVTRYRYVGLFLLVALGWGGSYPSMKFGLEAGLAPIFYAGLRFDIAAVILIVYVALAGGDWLPRTRDDIEYLLISAFLIIALNNAFLLLGQQYTSSGLAAIVYSLNPVLSAGAARVFLVNEGVSTREAVGFVLGLVGVAIVAQPNPGNIGSQLRGVAFLFLAACSVALGSVLSRRTEPTISTLSGAAWAMVFGAVTLHATAAVVGGGGGVSNVTMSPGLLAAVGFLGVGGTAVAYGAYFPLLDAVGPVRTNLVSYVVPIVASVSGWLVLGSALTSATLIGFLVIFVGFVLLNWDVLATELRRAAPGLG